MTCEFENEVPIRATIIADLASYQFEGRPGPSAADRAIMSCASIAKLLLADRDPVAAILLKSDSRQRIDHGSGERQLTRLLQVLLAASDPNPPVGQFWIDGLVKLVFDNCSRRFPELFDEQFNTGPVRLRLLRVAGGKNDRVRRSLAVVLEHLFDLAPGMSTRMQFDNYAMRKYCLRYVEQYSVVASSTNVSLAPPWKDLGTWLRERRRMTLYLCDNLIEAKSRAKDNELFVVISPEPPDQDCLNSLETAVKNVLSAKHRVIFVAPTIPRLRLDVRDPVAKRIMVDAMQINDRKTRSKLRSRLTKLGAAFARIDDPALIQIVAAEIGILQSGKTRGGSALSR